MNNLLAQSFRIVPSVGVGTPQPSPVEITGPLDPGIDTIGSLITRLSGFLMPLGIIALLLVFISGGYDFLLARGNPEKVKSGKAKLTAGIIGFVLLISSYLLVKILSMILGLGGGVI